MNLVQVLPESRFGLRISIEFHLKKRIKNPVTAQVTGFLAPISKSVRIIGCGGGICWPCQKHSRLGHSAGLVPDTPCFFPCRARFTVHRTRLRSKPTPSSVGRGGDKSISTRNEKRHPTGCLFVSGKRAQKRYQAPLCSFKSTRF